ncbi:receptor-like protein EIX2 [Mercurialis annua]|uniref:receptor-like protein EIX2 n=1 Tax=Mercurialis annua TaxID=3986 RepID=UPI00215F9B26|nr:receptor-like protein EIX2 [Mercurialis annua]
MANNIHICSHLLLLFLFFNFTTGCIPTEREALLTFKNALIDPSARLSSWTGPDCCKWNGVVCSADTGNVIQLHLRNPYNLTHPEYLMSGTEADAFNRSCLSGQLHPSLLQLKHLQYLDLSVNNFQHVPIPSFISNLTELRYLNLSHASFAGNVPPEIGNLQNLESLDLFTYSYLIPFPEKLWVSEATWISGLSQLKYLNLGNVNLSLISNTWAQSLSKLNSLVELRLSACDLVFFPQSVSSLSFNSLQLLHLHNNFFNSSIPQWLFNITTLVELNLMNSELTGPISSYGWGHLCNLKALDLTYNGFSGEVGQLLDSFSECNNFSLEVLHLGYNQFTGLIPESLGKFQSLRSLRIFGNSISGTIPESVEGLSLLQDLDLSANKLSGTIPEIIGRLKSLTYLDLFGNYWVGNITESHFMSLKNLKVFSLSSVNKSLAFDVRQDWIPPFSLQVILVRDCQLGPKFPEWLETQKELARISLIDDAISDTIPAWLWKLSPQIRWLELQNNEIRGTVPESLRFTPGMIRLDVSSNHLEGVVPMCSDVQSVSLSSNLFSGSIPSTIGQNMSSSVVLELAGNSLSGEIPSSMSEMKKLNILDLSNNQLSGVIPENWQGMEDTDTIDFSQNNLSGGIPGSMCSLPKLQVLKLSRNNLSGLLSESLKNCTHVSSLDLGHNQFVGSIPSWIGERLASMEILILRANNLNGIVPESLCGIPDLHILDFAHNNLSGSLPTCLGNLSGLKSFRPYSVVTNRVTYIQEVQLNVKGRQVDYTKIVAVVNVIDMSVNNLQGLIPDEISKLSYLGTLNVSWNRLTGEIPENIGNLKLLETLDLSCNQLSGPIPMSMPSMTGLNYLNLSHNSLSGAIPLANQFQTFVNPSIYEGNPGLCGFPLPNSCFSQKDKHVDEESEDEDGFEMVWFFTGLAPGYVVGFWVVVGTLILKKAWRNAYFQFVDNMKDSVYSVLTK